MSLNIKNRDAHRPARELSELTGESLTTAVTEALRRRYASPISVPGSSAPSTPVAG